MNECDVELPITDAVNRGVVVQGDWATLAVPLSCLVQRGASFDKVMAPFVLTAAMPMQIAISDIKIVVAADSDQQQMTCD